MIFDSLAIDDADCPIAVRAYQAPTQFIRLFREYFTTKYKKFIPSLDGLIYSGPSGPLTASATVSGMEIMRLGEEREEITDLPKLLIRREPMADQTVGLRGGQRMMPRPVSTFETVSVGSITIFGMSRRIGESEMLAFEVFELLRHFREPIRKKLGYHQFKPNQVGAPGRLRAFPRFFATPVTLDYSYRDNVHVFPDRMPIRELNLKVE